MSEANIDSEFVKPQKQVLNYKDPIRARLSAHVFLIREGQVFLLRYGIGRQAGIWVTPGGERERVDKSFLDTAKREVLEETGAVIRTSDLNNPVTVTVTESNGFVRLKYYFLCDKFVLEPQLSEALFDQVEWFKLDNLPDTLCDSDEIALKKLLYGDFQRTYEIYH